jgi:hypothetical protein
MTASDDNNSESDNSASRSTTRDESPYNRRDCLPLAARVRNTGWASLEKLAVDFGFTELETRERLELLGNAGDVELVDLGTTTLVVSPDVDVHDAIAELSDQREREWRALNNWQLPDRGDFR